MRAEMPGDEDQELDDEGFETTTGFGYTDDDADLRTYSRDADAFPAPNEAEHEEHEKTREELRETREEMEETREELEETREELRETREEIKETQESGSDEGDHEDDGFEVEP